VNNVWIVTEGDYSDYHICGVFSSEEKAREFINAPSHATEYGIEQWDIDSLPQLQWRQCWRVYILMSDGSWYHPSQAEGSKMGHWEIGDPNERGYGNNGPVYCSGHSYISWDHALKLAAEKRQEVLRLRAQGLGDEEIRKRNREYYIQVRKDAQNAAKRE
jgi:hypothetical protein